MAFNPTSDPEIGRRTSSELTASRAQLKKYARTGRPRKAQEWT